MLYLNYVIILNISFMANAMLIEDLQILFENRHCIKASSVSMFSVQDRSVMLDKDSTNILQESIKVNVSEITKTNDAKSPTSRINELAQYNEIKYLYELVSEEGPPHNKNFKVTLTLGDEKYEGAGPSLKKAQQEAALLALANTFYQHPPIKLKLEQNSLTPTVILNNLATKLGIAVSYFLLDGREEQAIASYGSSDEPYGKSKNYPKINYSEPYRVPTEEPQISGPFRVRVKVGESEFVGLGHTVQGARHDAATKAIQSMEKEILYKDNVCAKEDSVGLCKQKKESLKSPVSRVYETGQKHNLPVEFNVISESGKSHNKVFVTQCKLGDFTSEGEGKSKKESKRIAAERMLENLIHLHRITDGTEIINSLKNKKKKNKKKTLKNNVNSLGIGLTDVLSTFWGTNDISGEPNPNTKVQKEGKSKPKTASTKDNLLEVANNLNIEITFTDLSKNGDDFYTLVSLGLDPVYICLGKAPTRDTSHHEAAAHGLKFLHKLGVLDKAAITNFSEMWNYNKDDYLAEDHVIYGSIEKSKDK